MGTVGYIRIIGDHHATPHHGTVLAVTDSPTSASVEVVYYDRAAALVAKGEAEWIGSGAGAVPQGAVPEAAEVRSGRHEIEHDAMVRRHEAQHREMMERHAAEHDAAMVAAADAVKASADRHAGEHADLVTRHADEHERMIKRHAAEHDVVRTAASDAVKTMTGIVDGLRGAL